MRPLVISLLAALLAVPLAAQPERQAPPPWMPDLWAPETPLPAQLTPPPPEEDPPRGAGEELATELAALQDSIDQLAGDLETAPAGSVPSEETAERRPFEELRTTGRAPVLARPTGVVYPFGETVPTLVCAPDRACDLELEAGEVVDGLALGASDRWEVTQFFEGEGEVTPHILLKPSDFGLRSNLVVVTNRRSYHLELEAVEPGAEEAPAFHHHVAFWYPERWAERFRSEAEAKSSSAREEVLPEAFDPRGLFFGYELREPRRPSRRLPWRPVAVFDDGERIFLKLPAEARPLPAVLGRLADGSRVPLNETYEGDTFTIPVLVPELELVSGSGKGRRSLVILRRRPPGGPGR